MSSDVLFAVFRAEQPIDLGVCLLQFHIRRCPPFIPYQCLKVGTLLHRLSDEGIASEVGHVVTKMIDDIEPL
jgi:hypothetical protein